MRTAYAIVMSVTIVFTIITSIRTKREKGLVSSLISKMHIGAAVAEFANLLIAIPYYESRIFILFSYALYFASIDWILYYMLAFSCVYTGRDENRELKRVKLAKCVAIVDTVIIFSNIITGKVFGYYLGMYNGKELFSFTTMSFLYQLHLIFDYLLIVIVLVILIKAIKEAIGFYKIRYISPITIIVAIVILNAVYMFFGFPLDWSVVLYSISGMLLHFYSTKYVPESLITKALRQTADDLSEGLILFDIEDKCIYVNKSATKMFGLSLEEISLKSFPVNGWINGIKPRICKPFAQEYDLEKDGNTIRYKLELKHIREKKGQYLGCYFVITDITKEHNTMAALEEVTAEAIEAREEATRANLAKGNFLANMSHEIRTPINAILGMNEMILRENTSPEIQEFAKNIQISGDALLSIINDILDFSKIESGKMEMQLVKYKPYKIVRACHTMIAPRIEAKGLRLMVRCDRNCPKELYGDEVRIRQILTNLLTNAAKYTEKGTVEMVLKWEQGSGDEGNLVLSVKDTGIGISKENQKKLFNAFERVDEKRNRNIEGTGLGLSITSELVRLMSGQIYVESEYGNGSIFTVRIPQTIVDSTPSGEYNPSGTESNDSEYHELFKAPTARILAVDDYKMNLIVLKGLLKKTEVQIVLAYSGQEALDLAAKEQFDLVFMDHMMPGMDGIETLKRMREIAGYENIPVIMLSANALSGVDKEYISQGFDDYLSKPVKGEKLELMLRKYLPKDKVFR